MEEHRPGSLAQIAFCCFVRAAAYKKNMDLKNEDILNAGFEQVKSMVFEAMARERPDLYKDVAKFLEEKRSDI